MGTVVDDGNPPCASCIVSPPNLTEIDDEHDWMHGEVFIKKVRNYDLKPLVKLANYHSFIGRVL